MAQADHERKLGTIWLAITAPVAIGLTVALYAVANRTSETDMEQLTGNNLRQLRSAQSSISTGSLDPRQSNSVKFAPGGDAHTSHLVAVPNAELHGHSE